MDTWTSSVRRSRPETSGGRSEIAGERFVLVTVGNGRVGFPLLDAYVRALEQLPGDMGLFSLIVGGPELPPEQAESIRRRCGGTGPRHPSSRTEFVGFLPRLLDCISAADVVVSQSGYNTVSEILSLEKRAVVVPYASEHREQEMRASLLDRLGLIRTIRADQLSPERLAGALVAAFQDGHPTRQRIGELGFEFGGLQRVRDHVLRLLGRAVPAV